METSLNLNAIDTTKVTHTTDNTELISQIRQNISQIKKENPNPAKNQENLLTQVLTRLNSNYPYSVLTGETGIGKTLTLDFIVKMLSDEKYFDKTISKLDQTDQSLFSQIQQKNSNQRPTGYLFIPNFSDHKTVTPISYTSNRELEQDAQTFNTVGNKIIKYINKFPHKNIDFIREQRTENQIGELFKSSQVTDKFLGGLEELLETQKTFNEKFPRFKTELIESLSQSSTDLQQRLGSILDTVKQIEEENELIEQDKNSTTQPIDIEQLLTKSPFMFRKAREGEFELKELSENLKFNIPVGSEQFDLHELFTANPIMLSSSDKTNNIKCVKYSSINDKSLILELSDEAIENELSSSTTPPHQKILSLGSIFEGEIIYVKDDFKSFLKDVHSNHKKISKQRFLEYLQTGTYVHEAKGINYEFDIPRIIIGADNQDPFFKVEGGLVVVHEKGLEARIQHIKVPAVKESSTETKSKTIEVMLDEIQRINTESNCNVEFSNEALNIKLNEYTPSQEIISLEYRKLSQELEELMTFAKSRDISTIDETTIKLFKKLQSTDLIFNKVDSSINDYEVQTIPKQVTGHVNGLYFQSSQTSDLKFGGFVGVKSKLSTNHSGQLKSDRIILSDSQSGLTDETTKKGFNLAAQFVMNYLNQIEDKSLLSNKKAWEIATQFHKTLGIAGNSASTAIAASIISEISQRPIFTNRYITGTLEPTGEVGAIGGVYEKATAPYRVAQVTGQTQHMMFPASNLFEIEQGILCDPLEMQNSINLIPVKNFNQAYALLSNPEINDNIITNSNSLGESILRQDLQNIETILKKEYQTKKKFFFF